jgi:hypothetical protein
MTRTFWWSLMEQCEQLAKIPSTLDPIHSYTMASKPYRQAAFANIKGGVAKMKYAADPGWGYHAQQSGMSKR